MSLIDPDEYRRVKPDLLKAYKRGGQDGVIEYCVLSSVPIIAACMLILEDIESDKLTDTIERLRRFYQV